MLTYFADELSLWTMLPTIRRHNQDYGYVEDNDGDHD